MIRKVLLSTVLAVTAGSALAADLPARVAPAPYIPAPIFTWTGFYVGLNAGAAFNNNRGFNFFGPDYIALPPTTSFFFGGNGGNNSGFTGGAQAGYNMQFGSFVAGLEADINYVDNNKGSTGILPTNTGAGTFFTVSRGRGSDYFGTVRGRLGYAFDRALIYVTGGLAYGGNNGGGTVFTNVVTVNPTLVTTTAITGTGGNSSNVGWTLGGGLEYAFSNAWSVRAEYLHVDLGKHSSTFITNRGVNGVILHDDNKFDVVRAGINYRF